MRMAENILVSNKHAKRFESLLLKLSDPDPHARSLAYLVTRALFAMLSGENLVDAAQRVLDSMAITSLEDMGGFLKGADTLQEVCQGYDRHGTAYHLPFQFLNDTSLGTNVVLKPQSRNTLHWLQTSLLCLIPILPRPSGDTLNFTDTVQSVLPF
jgi:U3 small nucleolar RNA-associated protein 10